MVGLDLIDHNQGEPVLPSFKLAKLSKCYKIAAQVVEGSRSVRIGR